jgi:hypothetical protein
MISNSDCHLCNLVLIDIYAIQLKSDVYVILFNFVLSSYPLLSILIGLLYTSYENNEFYSWTYII